MAKAQRHKVAKAQGEKEPLCPCASVPLCLFAGKVRQGQILRWLLVGLAIISVLAIVFVWMVRALPHIALAQIGEMTNTRIGAESVNLGFDGSVLIRNLVIRPDQEQKYDDAILKAETVYARFSLGSLLLLNPRLKEIRVNDFLFDAQYDLDADRWNVAALEIRVPRNGSGEMPAVRLSQGTLQYSKVSNGQATVAASVPVRAEFGFDQWTQEGYRFDIRTAALSSGFGKSNLSGFFKPARPELAERGRITVTGGVSSTDIPELEWAWVIDVLAAELTYGQDRNYSLKLRAKGCHSTHTATADPFGLIGPSSLAKSTAFSALQSFFSRYRPAGTVDIDLDASGNLDRLNEITASGKVYCKDVSICDRHFPYAIERLAGQVDFTQDSVVLNALSGRHGDVDITIDGLVNGFGPAQQYQLRVKSNNMLLDNDLYSALSIDQKNLWDAFSPGGRVAVDQRFSRKSQADGKTTLTIDLLDAQAAYKHFPYPLGHLTGKLFFERDSVLVSDVVSQVRGCKITFNGSVTGHNTDRPICYFSIKAENVPLDSKLAAALPAGRRSFYDRFGVAGLADAEIKVFSLQKDPGEQGKAASFLADVAFKEASLKVGQAPLLISDVLANTVITPDSISIKELTGRCSDGQVSITGVVSLTDRTQMSPYHLTVDAKQTQLSAELVDLLPGPAKRFFCESAPQGRINLAADLRQAADEKEPSYQIAVECLGDSVAFKQFAYPLKNVFGKLVITNKTLAFENVTAAPASGQSPIADRQSQITLNGEIALTDESGNVALSASDIAFDEQLGSALTNTGVAPFYGKLRPSGRFDLDSVSIKVFAAKNEEVCVDFAGAVRLKDCRFDLFGTDARLNALLNAKGLYKIPAKAGTGPSAGGGQGSSFSAGALSLSADDLTVKGKAITNLSADINYDPDTQSWRAENLLADCYGGKVAGKLEISGRRSGTGDRKLKYLLQVGFDKVDLRQFFANDHTGGTMGGALSVVAEVGDAPLAEQVGQCRFIIRDMEVGKLSPLAKLLYVLKLTEPKDFAFEQMVVDSYIKADMLLFDKFDLSGPAVAFSGTGQMDLASDNVDLVLTARGKRLAAAEPSLVQSLAEGLGQAVVRMEVTGNVHDPQVTTRTLPVIEDSLKILGTKRK